MVLELISLEVQGKGTVSIVCAEEGGRSWRAVMEREHTLFKDLYELREDLGKYIIIIIILILCTISRSLYKLFSS